MKKVLLAGAALMLAGGIYSTASAAAVTPGVTIDGDARVRLFYKSVEYSNGFGNTVGDFGSQTNVDSRVRFNLTGTTAGGTYAKARIKVMENAFGNQDYDLDSASNRSGSNLWADMAYVGIPFSDMFTLEVGKYRSTYGPLPATMNFFYDDVQLTGARGIVKIGDVVINPFVEWMNEAQNSPSSGSSNTLTNSNGNLTSTTAAGTTNAFTNAQSTLFDKNKDNDEYRIGAHVQAKINKDWTVGGMLGYQIDNRTSNPSYTTTTLSGTASPSGPTTTTDAFGNVTTRTVTAATATSPATLITTTTPRIQANQGLFGSVYANGKAGQFGIVGEMSYTAAGLNGFNSWAEDNNATTVSDSVGSVNDGYGGFIFPNYQIDKLNLGLNLGFTTGGFKPDRCFGFVMVGGKDNSVIGDAVRIGDTGDWLWIGFVPSYQISDSLKLTGNLVYADINKWKTAPNANGFGGGPNAGANTTIPLDNAWEVSAVLQYTITKGTDIYFSAGYLKPTFDATGFDGITSQANLKTDGLLGAATRLEVKF